LEKKLITFTYEHRGRNLELKIWPQKPDWSYQYCILIDAGHCMVPVYLGERRMFGTYHTEQRHHIEDIADTILRLHLDKIKTCVII